MAVPETNTPPTTPHVQPHTSPPPCALVLFGARGDLTKRLVIPSLYNLACQGLLPQNFALIGVDHGDENVETWSAALLAMLKSFVGNTESEAAIESLDMDVWLRLAAAMSYVRGDFESPALYSELSRHLEAVAESAHTEGNIIFYLATPDRFFGTVVDQLGAVDLARRDAKDGRAGWRRIVVEKPFGNSFESAKALNAQILQTFREDQIYRIDHFLGKDAVQNIMTLRFSNGIFEPLWNCKNIDHIQVTVAETIGVERRGKFYEVTGALRDMVPNHVFTLISLIAMEPPGENNAAAINANKSAVFAAMRSVSSTQAVRGQYGRGSVSKKDVAAYRDEMNVAANSNVETYVAMQLEIDTPRWAGVPIYLRTGKHMSRRLTEIAICFKNGWSAHSGDAASDHVAQNWLLLHISPDEGVSMEFSVRRPGAVTEAAPVTMKFRYDDWFPKESNVGYETLLYDVMRGDSSLFTRADMAEQCWRVVQPVLDAWDRTPAEFPNYASGSAGPDAADALLKDDHGRAWRPLT